MTLVVTHTTVTGAAADSTALVDGPAWDANHTLTGVAGLSQGGTAANLSATGGAGQVLKQDSAGAVVTVGTVAASEIASGAALTKADDTNVTLTLGGTPTTALLKASSLTLGWTGTLSAARGGTGTGTYAVGDVLYADTTTTLARLADVATGNALISGGTGTAPAWGKIGLSTHISGFGTGIATALAINTGSAGAPVLFNGALGTPTSGTLTSCTAFTLTTTGSSGAATYSAGTLNVPQYSGTSSNFNVKDPAYGATGNAKAVAVTASITSGSPNLTATGATFVSGDVGKTIEVPGAGAAGAGLVTTILTFTDATHVVLAANASTTLTAASKTIYYGTDDTAAIQAAIAAAAAVGGGILAGGGNVYVPAGGYMVVGSGTFILGWGASGGKLSGASENGTTFYIPSSVGTSRDFLLFQGSATGIVIEDIFVSSISATSGRHHFHFDSTGGQFYRNVVIRRVFNAAGGGHAIYINNTGSVGGSVFQGIIRGNNLFASTPNACIKIVKGGDSVCIDGTNLLSGTGYAIDADQQAGAGNLIVDGNNITSSGMVKIAGAIAPIFTNNLMEQRTTNNSTNNAMLDLIGGLDGCKVIGNQIQALASFGNPTLIRVDTATNTVIDNNRLSVPAVYAPIVITAAATNTVLGPGNYFPGSSSTVTNSSTSTNNYYGSWTAYTPTVTAQAGAITSYTATGRYKQIGKTVFMEADVTITTVGTATLGMIVTIPLTAAGFGYTGLGSEIAINGHSGRAYIAASSTTLDTREASGTSWFAAGNGVRVIIGATYEVP